MQGFGSRGWVTAAGWALTMVIAGCASPRTPAPVEDRGTMTKAPPPVVTTTTTAPGGSPLTVDSQGRPLAGIENYGKPGYYAVRPGDTIRRIGTETGQRWQDIARWNNLDNPDQIEVGQVLRVIPPAGAAGAVATAPPAPATTTTNPPVATAPTVAAATTPTVTPPPANVPVKPPVTTSSVAPAAAAAGDEDVGWIWPTSHGSLIAGFDEAKNKGLDISGKTGDPVLAAADGRVVYAGAGLRGYGNLIILKHNNTYLTAYAHNQTLLVKEDQSVQKGQKIAEMGNSDADRVKLHFEIRRQGKPVDPARYLPAR